jgi:hypothetical protein
VGEFVPEHEAQRFTVERLESFHCPEHKVVTVVDSLRRRNLDDPDFIG